MSDERMGFMIPLPRARKQNQKHPVQPMAQAMELTDRFNRAQVRHDWKPGMLCVEKAGLSIFTDSPVMIFWRTLDLDDWQDRKIIQDYIRQHMVDRIDCMVARLSDDSRFVVWSPHSVDCLEPYHEAAAGPESTGKRQSSRKA